VLHLLWRFFFVLSMFHRQALVGRNQVTSSTDAPQDYEHIFFPLAVIVLIEISPLPLLFSSASAMSVEGFLAIVVVVGYLFNLPFNGN
jgi:hypothetical protein